MTKLGDLFPDEMLPKAPPPAAPAKSVPKPIVRSLPPRPLPVQGKPVPREIPSEKRLFVKDVSAGDEVEGVFLVAEATLRVGKNGSKYIQGALMDKTGSVAVRQWDATDQDLVCYKTSGFVKIRGRAETYKNALQMIVHAVQVCDGAQINSSDFMPVSSRPAEEMEKEFNALLETFTDPDYKLLLTTIFSDANVRAKFFKNPAANSIHHAWVGGLLEHVLSACKTAQSIAEQRPFLNRDLLMAGVLLHDIGKIEELSSDPGFNYTDTGRLCGHIVLGALLVERNILKLKDFPPKKRDLVIHMILSHHGELEYGSPVMPMTGEAVALHHLECLDAKVQGIQSIIERERANGNDGPWSEFSRVVDGRIYKG